MPLDSQNMLQVIKDFPTQCRQALGLPKGISVSRDISNIVVTGMGGSAIGGDLLKAYLSNGDVPVYVNRDYKVPNFVNKNTLVFVVLLSTPNAVIEGYGIYKTIEKTLKQMMTIRSLVWIYLIFFIAAVIEVGYVYLLSTI